MQIKLLTKAAIVFLAFAMMSAASAGKPLWTFAPQTPVAITVVNSDSAQVSYVVHNQSSKLKTLLIKPITGVSQSSPCQLAPKGTCLLTLTVTGSALAGDVIGGPVLCQQGDNLQCYQPRAEDILHITKAPSALQFTVTPSADANGSISPSTAQAVSAGGSILFTATPNAGFRVGQWIVDGNVVQEGGTSFTLNNIVSNHTVSSIFISNYTVGGSTFGLQGTLVLVNNGGDAITLDADSPFTFANALSPGETYSVTVQSQPATQLCTVDRGHGTITHTKVTNITVHCSTNTRTVGGSVSELAAAESVVLQNNGGDNLTVNSNSAFTFSTPVAQSATYEVTVLTHPTTQTCTVMNRSGTAGVSNITNVQVTCATNAFKVGGTVSGLSGTVELQNNNGDNLTLNSNDSYTFPTRVAHGATYSVTVLTQPPTQTCTVSNHSGTMGGAEVTNVDVDCVVNTTTLTTSTSDLALSRTGLTEYGVDNTPSSGLARRITITNPNLPGSNPALNLSVTSPIWPAGTISSTTCGSTLAVGSSCTITVTPGNTATSDGTNPCSSGTAPIPGVVQVQADNANPVSTNVLVLDYGCIYQGGYVYAFDDSSTYPNTGSVGGKVVTTSDQAAPLPNGVNWSSNTAANSNIYGISETSTPASPNPSSGQVSGQTACNGATDGFCNTTNIVAYYSPPTTDPALNQSSYASGRCKGMINNYADWYLPAICEMGYGAAACGTSATPRLQNIQSSLIERRGFSTLASYYWSSTQYNQANAWAEFWSTNTNSQGAYGKRVNPLGVRCSRALTP